MRRLTNALIALAYKAELKISAQITFRDEYIPIDMVFSHNDHQQLYVTYIIHDVFVNCALPKTVKIRITST